MAKDTRIFIRVDEDEKAALQSVAETRGTTISKLVRDHISRIIKRNKPEGGK